MAKEKMDIVEYVEFLIKEKEKKDNKPKELTKKKELKNNISKKGV